MRWLLGVVVLAATLGAVLRAGAATPPSGASAICRDATYSYSLHHSGTCSHHGGVARWLDGSTVGTASAGSTSGSTRFVGTTVLLASRTKTTGCHLGAIPDPACSPGATYSALTKNVICSSTFRTSAIRHVPTSEKHAVEVAYGLVPKSYGHTLEIDHIVSLELGGSNDIANLYPELANANPGYHVKDKLENRLHSMVCAGSITLRDAQVGIATNWIALYKRVFGVAPVG
ncbi:MAG: DUF3761 domain-containing protein [Actinobacteria bacterium]|uniref:Unannotated protein n=1 Tax=freshwater metagenome TaxID=449393 RepID=A0A6J6NWA2_9ZZZZ|nr:DUF3761 domain-containing protein [Actinomycetota bacterium]